MSKGTCVAALAILSWLPAQLQGRQVPRQIRLEAFRASQDQVRV